MAERGSRGARQRARTEAERARLYAARAGWHEKQVSRRRRDNWIAAVVGGLIVIGAIVSQTVLGQTTAPVPEPTPTSTDAPASPAPTETPAATDTPAPIETPAPTDAPAE